MINLLVFLVTATPTWTNHSLVFDRPIERKGFYAQVAFGLGGGPNHEGLLGTVELGASFENGITLAALHVFLQNKNVIGPYRGPDALFGSLLEVKVPLFRPELEAKIAAGSDAWDAPMLLGEFGAGVTTRDSQRYIEAFYTWLDARFVSATQWNYTPAWTPEHKDGWNTENFSITGAGQTLRPELFHPRAYPQKTAGTPISFKRSTTGFTYRWTNDPSQGATEIFILDDQSVSQTLGVSCERVGHTLSCVGVAGEVSVRAD